MTKGKSRTEVGVSESMIATFGETIFKMSHNHQIRRGDPIRLRDFAAIEAQREDLGLSDGQIAARIGLTVDQVIYIRNMEEARRFTHGNYNKLNGLGGAKRYRAPADNMVGEGAMFSKYALSLRDAMTFDAKQARHYVAQGWWADDTLCQWLRARADERPNAPALISDNETISYGELHNKAERLAGGLWRLGLRRGDVVGVQLPNTADYLISYLAIGRIGAVMTTIYVPYRAKEMKGLLEHSGARALICLTQAGDFAAAKTAVGLCSAVPSLDHVIAIGADADVPEGAVHYDGLFDGESLPSSVDPVAADPFLLLYTSGTTAQPKGVPLAYHNMLSNARLGVDQHGITADDIIVSAAPFGHLFGLYSVHLALATGAACALLPIFTPPDLVKCIAAHKATVLFAAPAHIGACLGASLFADHDVTSLKMAILSGAAVPGAVVAGLAQAIGDGAVTQLWGMTETQGGLYTRPTDAVDLASRSAGRPSPGTQARITDGAGTVLAAGEDGELEVRGCSLFPGYYNNPDANETAFSADGWFRSGDLATMDGEGNVTITGRTKDIINRGGVKYNPRDIEDLIDAHPAIAQSAIVPMPDPVLGERACCFAVLAGDATVSLDEICAYLSENGVARFKLPERLEIVAEMPLTATRKIIKGRLKLPN